jgi:hypothetical protein
MLYSITVSTTETDLHFFGRVSPFNDELWKTISIEPKNNVRIASVATVGNINFNTSTPDYSNNVIVPGFIYESDNMPNYKYPDYQNQFRKKELEKEHTIATIKTSATFEIGGINFKRTTLTIKPNHYLEFDAKISLIERQPIINYQTGGLKEIQKISCGVYKVDYSELNLTTESYPSVSIISDTQMTYSLVMDYSDNGKVSTIVKFYDLFVLHNGLDTARSHLDPKEYGLRDPKGFFLHVKGY